ncbi:MAG: hypothetical protein J6P98_01895, partial [Clostridia bacterium]|nr:hypothetical protein [Clostridia bacterium]
MMKQKSIFPAVAQMLIGLLVLVLAALTLVRGLHYYNETNLTGRGVVLFIVAGLIAVAGIIIIILGIMKAVRTTQCNRLLAIGDKANASLLERHMGMKATSTISNAFIYMLLIVISIIWLIPFVCIILQSFRVESTSPVGYIVPQKWGFDNYVKLLSTNFPRWYLNTFIIAIVTAVLQTVIVLCMSYVLSRFRFKMRKTLMQFMLILGMFPGMLSMIILYRVLKDLGMTQANAVPGLILVYVASSGMGYYISKGFFDTIPKSLDEAA